MTEVVANLRVRRFSGLFWPLFDFFCRGHIRKLILPLQKKSKIGSKEPENRQNLSFAATSTACEFSKRFYEGEARRFKVKIAACLLLMDQEKICLQRRQGTGIDDGWYTIPMGGVEKDERPLETLIREAQEEINIEILPENVRLGHSMYRKHTLPDGYVFYQQDLFFHASKYSGEIKNLEPHKADDLRFFHLSALPTKLVPHVAQAIDCTIRGQPYSEFGFL